MSEEKPLHVLVAEALGWRAWLERRGEYELAVCQKPEDREPWTHARNPKPERYREVSLDEAMATGFYGTRWPDYTKDWSATGPLIERLKISLFRQNENMATPTEPGGTWAAGVWGQYGLRCGWYPTPLEAVCRLILQLDKDTLKSLR